MVAPRGVFPTSVGMNRAPAGAKEDKAHWFEVGRCYERFTLQATALGIRTAHVHMPVDAAALRPKFAEAIGLGSTRPIW